MHKFCGYNIVYVKAYSVNVPSFTVNDFISKPFIVTKKTLP